MRHKDTIAITITLPGPLHQAVVELARKRECGNLSAVIRNSLYKEVGIPTRAKVKESAIERIQQAEARTAKYSHKRKRGQV